MLVRRERRIDNTVHKVTEFSSPEHFLSTVDIPAGVLTILDNGLPIDLLVSPASSNTTIFFFHGAIEPHFTLPVLSGLGISGGLDVNRVFVSDPSLVLDEKLMLAWYAGNYLQPNLQQTLTLILNKIATTLGSTKTIFFGGSGGGFASLYFASRVHNSLAIVFNPQTNMAKYSPRAVESFAQRAFRFQRSGGQEALTGLPSAVTTDLRCHYSSGPATTVAYLQNLNDKVHFEHHLKPFRKVFRLPTKLFILAERWRQGHSPPPKELLTQLLNMLSVSEDWSQDLELFGFNKYIT